MAHIRSRISTDVLTPSSNFPNQVRPSAAMKYLPTHSRLLPLELSEEAIAGLRMEIKLLSQLDHANIVKLVEAFDTNESVSPV